ncbi:MAG: hypothetical protein RLP09_05165 [Sandaracinaceae bacterium]
MKLVLLLSVVATVVAVFAFIMAFRREPAREKLVERQILERQVIVRRCTHCGALFGAERATCDGCGAPG